MPTKPKPTNEKDTLDILEVQEGSMVLCLLGKTPIIHNRLSQKVTRQLLLPSKKKNQTERETTLKHDPLEEYRASPHRFKDTDAPTLLAIPCAAFHKAMMDAALRLPGTKKTEIGQLTWVEGQYAPCWGVPQLSMMPVRSADMNHTPDIRTRAICPTWATRITLTFTQPLIQPQACVRLLAAAGIYIGVGDGRKQKGTFAFGCWRLVEPSDVEFRRILAEGGRLAQEQAIETPEFYDQDTEDLYSWYVAERNRRAIRGVEKANNEEKEEGAA